MKKLFTLFAFLACFLGAKAVTVTDASIKFTECTEFKDYLWGNEEAKARLSIDSEGLHFHSEEATGVNWDCQFSPLPRIENIEVGVTYTVKLKVKGSPDASIAAHLGGVDNYSAIHFTSDWEEYTIEYTCTDPKGEYGSNNALVIQCGSFVGDYWIEYMTITHEEREQRPVQWQNILTNGDAEGEYGEPACVYSKEFGMNLDEKGEPQPHPAEITTDGDNKVFVCHAKAVDPVIVFDKDTELWGTNYKAGDPMPDNAWQNQFWVVLPRPAKEGEQLKLSFRYKASKAVNTNTQDHEAPGTYLGNGSYGDVRFTTEWQTYEKPFSAVGKMQSIAFNLGAEVYNEDMDFFLDDVKVEEMVLDHGFFVASTHTTSGLVDYDFDNAAEFTLDADNDLYVTTVGKAGDKDSWVNEVMISTVRGNDKAFKSATLKCTAEADNWVDYTEGSNAKITLPAAGVWTISIDNEQYQMLFEQVEGDEVVVKEPIEINPNPTVVVVKGQERDDLKTDETPEGTGNAWDNQFWIVANRTLKAGEVTVVEFDYVGSVEAKTTTQCHNEPGQYIHWAAIENPTFTTKEQHYKYEFTIPSECDGGDAEGGYKKDMKSIAFNMAEIKEACDYTIKNIVWKLKDDTESLIDQTGTKNFYVKEGASDTPHEFGTPSGISNVVTNNTVSTATYNVAGQRVSEDYKGIVIKNGKKYIVK